MDNGDNPISAFIKLMIVNNELLVAVDIRLRALRTALVETLGEDFNVAYRMHRDRLQKQHSTETGRSVDDPAFDDQGIKAILDGIANLRLSKPE